MNLVLIQYHLILLQYHLILLQYHLILQSTSCTSQDIGLNRSLPMKSKSDSVTPKAPQSSRRRISGGITVSEVYGFPIAVNQFAVLQENQTAVCQRSTKQTGGCRWITDVAAFWDRACDSGRVWGIVQYTMLFGECTMRFLR